MEIIRDEGDRAFNDLVCEVQQQFMAYKERTSCKFQMLEEMVELAARKMSLIMSIQAKHQEEGFVTPVGWKGNARQDRIVQKPGVIPHSVPHLELRLPKFEEDAEVFESSQDCEHQLAVEPIYDDEPIYDEESREGRECWFEHELFLAALQGINLDSPNRLSEICTNERSKELVEFPHTESPSQLEDYQEPPRYDEVPGNDKEDWHFEEIICIALGLEDFFQPKKTQQLLEEGNSSGATVLECSSDFQITPRKIKPDNKEDPVESIESEFQMSKGTIVFAIAKLDELRLQPVPCLFSKARKLVCNQDCPFLMTKEESCAIEKVPSIISKSMRKIVEVFPEDFLAAADSYELGLEINFAKGNTLVFDPGGQIQNKQIIRSKVPVAEAVLIISLDGELRHFKDVQLMFLEIDKEYSELMMEMIVVKSAGIQGQDIQNC